MSVQTSDYLDAIAHLPVGGNLILNDVPWEEYEGLLHDLGEGYAVRIAYDHGRLEIMSPTSRHEMYKELLLFVSRLAAEEVHLPFESRGSTTFKEKQLEQGAEPDTCFYIGNASRIIGKGIIDLSSDPPPDIIVEIDVSHRSTGKFTFYAAIGVPEIWRYDERRMQILHLEEQHYIETLESRFLTSVTAQVLTDILEQSKTEGQSAALNSFREWLRKLKEVV
jgi:Uma2 family endonuclease